jgi:hypothetical protein
MESSKRTMVVLLAREKRAITNYYIIKPSNKKTFLILTQLWRNSILHCENENLIKTDCYVGIKDVAPNISLAESGNLTQTGWYGKRFSILVIV